MTKSTKEQWFWEQRGFKRISQEYSIPLNPSFPYWLDPTGGSMSCLPTMNLNNLFKYAPIKIWRIEFTYGELGCGCHLEDIDENLCESFVDADNYEDAKTKTALALFLALYKSLGGE